MTSFPLQRYRGSLQSCGKELVSGNMHIVCPALNGMTNLHVFACLNGKIPTEEVSSVAYRVNTTKVVETLFPSVAVTLLPLHRTWQEAQIGASKGFGNVEVIDRSIRECLRIHEQIVKSPALLFALDQGNVFDRSMMLARLEHALQAQPFIKHFEVYYNIAS